jgi:magnesium chelatase family protein
MVSVARDKGVATVFVPAGGAAEASLIGGVTVMPVRSFVQLVDHLHGDRPIEPFQPDRSLLAGEPSFRADFANVKGQEHAKRALEVAASGGHNVFRLWPELHKVGV